MKKNKKSMLRKKLLLAFVLTASLSIFLTAVFSLIYFFRMVKSEAVENMNNSRMVAELIYKDKMNEVEFFARSQANSKALTILVDLNIPNRISQYLQEVVEREQMYHITAYDSSAKVMSSVGLSRSLIVQMGDELNLDNGELVGRALSGEFITTTEKIRSSSDRGILAITSAVPLERNNRVIGALLVRYVLHKKIDVVSRIRNLLNVQAGIFLDTVPVSMDGNFKLSGEIWSALKAGEKSYDISRMWFGGNFARYTTLYDWKDRPVGALGIYVSADRYIKAFLNAVIVVAAIMIILIAISLFSAYMISRNIVNPVNKLVDGVNKISNGDLTYEIVVDLKDEIGTLSEAFNSMRIVLREKISTIETMNVNLESTIKERTEQIEALLNKMKKYLSPQLYESISGGKRTVEFTHERKKLTIFFSDIKDFTSTTDSMEAEALSDILNHYLDQMAKIALEYGGTIDKFVGDAIMIFFGDPEFIDDQTHALKAVNMALEMKRRLTELREEWTEKGYTHEFHVRMGINTGYCTVGNFGSENRMDYTIIGSQVNLAQRLEAAAPVDGILVSHETYSLISDVIDCTYSGEIRVKGIHYPIKNYLVKRVRDATESYKKYLKKVDEGLVLKTILIHKDMTVEERQNVLKALSVAQKFTSGKKENTSVKRSVKS
jgi:class 3 adenylate cyclase/HAMP domain-containing protein